MGVDDVTDSSHKKKFSGSRVDQSRRSGAIHFEPFRFFTPPSTFFFFFFSFPFSTKVKILAAGQLHLEVRPPYRHQFGIDSGIYSWVNKVKQVQIESSVEAAQWRRRGARGRWTVYHLRLVPQNRSPIVWSQLRIVLDTSRGLLTSIMPILVRQVGQGHLQLDHT